MGVRFRCGKGSSSPNPSDAVGSARRVPFYGRQLVQVEKEPTTSFVGISGVGRSRCRKGIIVRVGQSCAPQRNWAAVGPHVDANEILNKFIFGSEKIKILFLKNRMKAHGARTKIIYKNENVYRKSEI